MSTSIGLGHRGDPSILREKLLNDLKRLESFLRILFKNRLALAGLVIILVFFALSALAPVLVGAYPTPVQGSATLQPPSDAHRLGTDYQGRDILTLLLYGGRISLLIGFSASAVAMILGTLVGLVGGYYGRITDQVLARATDFFLVIPWLPFAIVLSLVLGPSLQTTIIAIAVASWPTTARVIRSQVLTVKERLFIERARAAGAGTPYIIWKHVLPNVMPLVWAEAVLTISNAVFTEAFLSFFGLGPPPGSGATVSWGTMVNQAYTSLALISNPPMWWYFLPPGLAITLVVLGFAMVGFGLEDVVNPRLRRR